MDRNIETLTSDDDVQIMYRSGRSNCLIVVFNGVALYSDGTVRLEFLEFASQNGLNHVMLVQDMRLSWYSYPGVYEKIRTFLEAQIERLNPDEVISMGGSMGGYGTILFSKDLPFARCLAFCPQVTMEEGIYLDQRFLKYRENFGENHIVRTLNEVTQNSDVPTWIVAGLQSESDLIHLGLLKPSSNLTVFCDTRTGHNTPQKFKESGLLDPFIRAFSKKHIGKLEKIYNEFSAAYPAIAKNYALRDRIFKDQGVGHDQI